MRGSQRCIFKPWLNRIQLNAASVRGSVICASLGNLFKKTVRSTVKELRETNLHKPEENKICIKRGGF